jgi:hypothetical protein
MTTAIDTATVTVQEVAKQLRTVGLQSYFDIGKSVSEVLAITSRRSGNLVKLIAKATGVHHNYLYRAAFSWRIYGEKWRRLLDIPDINQKQIHLLARIANDEYRLKIEEMLKQKPMTTEELKNLIISTYGEDALLNYKFTTIDSEDERLAGNSRRERVEIDRSVTLDML